MCQTSTSSHIMKCCRVGFDNTRHQKPSLFHSSSYWRVEDQQKISRLQQNYKCKNRWTHCQTAERYQMWSGCSSHLWPRLVLGFCCRDIRRKWRHLGQFPAAQRPSKVLQLAKASRWMLGTSESCTCCSEWSTDCNRSSLQHPRVNWTTHTRQL